MPIITETRLQFVREPLAAPFGFKGAKIDELWQVVCSVHLSDGCTGLGVGVQSPLWSDPGVFAAHTPQGSNALMLLITEYALAWLRGRPMDTPPALMDHLLPEALAYGRQVTGAAQLSTTFVLNALVPVDFALWQLYAAQTGAGDFASLAASFTQGLGGRQTALGNIPLVTYDQSEAEIGALLDGGAFLLKIKIGANPGGRGDPGEMLAWDCARLSQIHRIAEAQATPHTDCGHPLYYLDANGRYDTLERLKALLDFAGSIGALSRIVLLEEPFPVGSPIDVSGLPVRIAADESAHCAGDIPALLQKGYRAIALKPIAKTLSATLQVLDAAGEVPCFCADLTVPPWMLEWNQHVAACLPCLPGLRLGVIESNGAQNYCHWQALGELAPTPHAPWLHPKAGVYPLPDAFYRDAAFLRPAAGYVHLLEQEG